jgi:hypothetical protein
VGAVRPADARVRPPAALARPTLDVVPTNASNLYSVYRRNQSATGNSTTWQANINSGYVDDRNVGFDAAKIGLAAGEIQTDPNAFNFGPADGDVYGCYGCAATPNGVIGWQNTTTAGSAGWTTITSATNINPASPTWAGKTDDRWTVQDLPGPFAVHHVCDPSHRWGC